MAKKPKTEGAVVTKTKERLKKPKLYKVLLHNDDFTTMDFVIFVLTSVFHHTEETATQIMYNVHLKGIGLAGIYTFEVAETKVAKVTQLAREREFPLLCTMEEE